jgi:hypothetical protein
LKRVLHPWSHSSQAFKQGLILPATGRSRAGSAKRDGKAAVFGAKKAPCSLLSSHARLKIFQLFGHVGLCKGLLGIALDAWKKKPCKHLKNHYT